MRIPSPGAHGRNIGLEHATGKCIAFLDDDDSWLPEKNRKTNTNNERTKFTNECNTKLFG